MKKLTLSVIILGIFASQSFALSAQDVENEIQAIEQLPLQQRVEKMNQLKEQINQLSDEEKQQVLNELSEKYQIMTQERQRVQTKAQENTIKEGMQGEMERAMGVKSEMEHSISDVKAQIEAKQAEVTQNSVK